MRTNLEIHGMSSWSSLMMMKLLELLLHVGNVDAVG
jgi:hypothetical protein